MSILRNWHGNVFTPLTLPRISSEKGLRFALYAEPLRHGDRIAYVGIDANDVSRLAS